MRVIVDRDPVSMGDDADPRAQEWEVPDGIRVGEVVARMAREYPRHGGSAAWTVEALHGAEAAGRAAPSTRS